MTRAVSHSPSPGGVQHKKCHGERQRHDQKQVQTLGKDGFGVGQQGKVDAEKKPKERRHPRLPQDDYTDEIGFQSRQDK